MTIKEAILKSLEDLQKTLTIPPQKVKTTFYKI